MAKISYQEKIAAPTNLPETAECTTNKLNQYFARIKESCTIIGGQKDIEKAEKAADALVHYFLQTGQEDALTKLNFMSRVFEIEMEFANRGGKYVITRSDLLNAAKTINNRDADNLLLAQLSAFQRVIPSSVVAEMLKFKDVFDDFFILCTDYTDDHAFRNQGEEERREIEKDPIMFGVIYPKTKEEKKLIGDCYDRLYFIADWVDDYCDLTLESLVRDYDVSKITVDAMTDYAAKLPQFLPKASPFEQVERAANAETQKAVAQSRFR